eukprot:6186464-Pleurochrysis_carterae.AAC.3
MIGYMSKQRGARGSVWDTRHCRLLANRLVYADKARACVRAALGSGACVRACVRACVNDARVRACGRPCVRAGAPVRAQSRIVRAPVHARVRVGTRVCARAIVCASVPVRVRICLGPRLHVVCMCVFLRRRGWWWFICCVRSGWLRLRAYSKRNRGNIFGDSAAHVHACVQADADARSSRSIDLSRYALRVMPTRDAPHALVIELYCPYERAYHFRAESDEATSAWGDAIAREQERRMRISMAVDSVMVFEVSPPPTISVD